MADQYVISAANLSYIENSLNSIRGELNSLDTRVDVVDENIRVVYKELGSLAEEFHAFVQEQMRANAKADAQQRLIQIRQEMEKRFGHYDVVRRTATGILQADDLEIVRRSTITTATEELMISTPGYWLAPCLVALAAWINNQQDLAERALREAMHRNDEKTSLFFALICRRADRKSAALKWTQRYLANQNEENLDRKTIIILDAFASGLLGADTEGVISKQMTKWIERLSEKPGFIDKQTDQWSDAILMKRKPLDENTYPYLRKYSSTWPQLADVMEGAMLHADILSYFMNIFEQESSNHTLKEQLDGILSSLVTDFDDEELPLRREEKYNQFVVDYNGDVLRAKQSMDVEQTAFETHKDFTQLLTDAAMKPESSNASVSTQKFAVALSKEWIEHAYSDVTARNRMNVPNEIQIQVDTFADKTTDGQNENELLYKFNMLVEQEKADELSRCVLSGFDKFCLFGGAAIGLIGLIMMIFGTIFLGLIATIAGIGLVILHFTKKKKVANDRQSIEVHYEQKRNNGMQIIRAVLAEVVDFRREFAQRDAESENVNDFLAQISPEQYVKRLSGSNRKIKINN